MIGWLILAITYSIFAFLVSTFLFALSKKNFSPNFGRVGSYGQKKSWRSNEYKTFWLTFSAIVWPLLIPASFVILIFKFIKPLTLKLISGWEYLINEVQNPRENV